MSLETQIREYDTKDKAACLVAFKSNVPLCFTEAEITDFTNFLEEVLLKPRDSKTYFYVVTLGNEVIGCGGFGDKDGNGIISLAWGLIHKDFHKKGYGERLLKFRLEQIKRLYPSQSVVIDTTQHSFGFFEKYGFRITKITNDFYEKGMHRYDMVYDGSKR